MARGKHRESTNKKGRFLSEVAFFSDLCFFLSYQRYPDECKINCQAEYRLAENLEFLLVGHRYLRSSFKLVGQIVAFIYLDTIIS